MTKEPSMEEILSSIKRIIAEDGDDKPAASAPRERRSRPAREPASHVSLTDIGFDDSGIEDEVLELTDSVSAPEAESEVAALPAAEDFLEAPLSESIPAPAARRAAPTVSIEEPGIVSSASELAARSSLAALSSLLVKPADPAADNTLEGLVREMLRPMLKDWLDANLPTLVEGMVAREIARITGRSL